MPANILEAYSRRRERDETGKIRAEIYRSPLATNHANPPSIRGQSPHPPTRLISLDPHAKPRLVPPPPPPPPPLVLLSPSGGAIRSFLRRLDEKSTGPAKAAGAVSSMSAARAMFQAKTTRGQTSSGGAGKDLWTQHANAIVGMEKMGQAGDPTCSKLSSCGECCAVLCVSACVCAFRVFRALRTERWDLFVGGVGA